MAEQRYKVTWVMPLGMGDGYGVKDYDLAKGMEAGGKCGDWLNKTEYGMAVWQALKAAGFDVADVRESNVYVQRSDGRTVYWVPYARWWQHSHPVGYKVHYIPVRVEIAPPSAEDVAEESRQKLERMKADLARQKEEAAAKLELAKIQAEIDKINREASGQMPPPPGPVPPGTEGFRTYELFGIVNGMNVPLAQAVICDRATGRCSVVPGGRVMVGEQPSDGFGLGGIPGRWQQFYSGRSPAEFGLDADKGVLGFDGTRGWVLDARFLSQVFGPSWRAALYS